MRRVAMLVLAYVGFASAAEALTVRDVIELSRAGLGEEVLLALIDVDRGVYSIDPETLKALKQAGVPERVIVAMVRSGRATEPVQVPPVEALQEPRAPEPQVVVIDHRDEPRVREVMVPVPVYVTVPTVRTRHRRFDHVGSTIEPPFVPFQPGLPLVRSAAPEPKREPVYWGFGGKLRPDAWKPEGHQRENPKRDEERK